MSVTVQSIELDKNCEACQAAGRALDGWRHVNAKATRKIHELADTITKLREALCKIARDAALTQSVLPDDVRVDRGSIGDLLRVPELIKVLVADQIQQIERLERVILIMSCKSCPLHRSTCGVRGSMGNWDCKNTRLDWAIKRATAEAEKESPQ